jgi:hypothetical protein
VLGDGDKRRVVLLTTSGEGGTALFRIVSTSSSPLIGTSIGGAFDCCGSGGGGSDGDGS